MRAVSHRAQRISHAVATKANNFSQWTSDAHRSHFGDQLSDMQLYLSTLMSG